MHDKGFWQNIVDHRYALPPKADLVSLTGELFDYLAHPDPELRDAFGYSILTRWIAVYRYFSTRQLTVLAKRLLSQLDDGLGDMNTDTVFIRSYSAAILALIVYRDVTDNFLSKNDLREILFSAQTVLLYERDLRVFDPQYGWINSVANISGLLRYLAMHKTLGANELISILETVTKKVCQPVDFTFSHDEEDRLARIVLPMMLRDELSSNDYAEWLNEFRLWLAMHETGDEYSPLFNATYQNVKYFLRALHVQTLLARRLSYGATVAQVDLLDVIRDFTL